MMNIYRNRLSFDFDSQGNTIDAMVGFNGLNDQGETAMATIRVTKEMLGDDKTFDDVSNKEITELAKQKWMNYIKPEAGTK
ncbi:hypothetical protein [Limosilactobacillus reuteri]|uniref:hypothetical protein n=1 Tax=Limosilactobacillus reuteri TaxID=1598 RepID=UPI00081BE76D|nr:hypothetical protein [Limosilactobacillus reuteri]MCH5379822.1 hypothetical protein [Limosilactobacillus reuteri]OCW63650.1 hypothetical protein BBP12_06115 [Limosilactobacillus reuteri]OCW65698.1 hypothetical protein BBP11_05060 [Limosilactobacillus reuteri]OCW66029.1 hypothetical protein BBP10_02580 [Limosilactobacillus reuteri]OCW68858.1 hypothetical protein BBP14_06295 [Limosilactobacillus reuteri]